MWLFLLQMTLWCNLHFTTYQPRILFPVPPCLQQDHDPCYHISDAPSAICPSSRQCSSQEWLLCSFQYISQTLRCLIYWPAFTFCCLSLSLMWSTTTFLFMGWIKYSTSMCFWLAAQDALQRMVHGCDCERDCVCACVDACVHVGCTTQWDIKPSHRTSSADMESPLATLL